MNVRSKEVASCVGVARTYARPSGIVVALDGIDASFAADRLTVLSGPSGSGKSSLLRLIGGLDVPTRGDVWVEGALISRSSSRRRRSLRKRKVSYVFQKPSQNLISYLTVQEHMKLAASVKGAAPRDVERTLEELNLTDLKTNRPAELSGGEQQRLAFAQASLGEPALILADEPTAELDRQNVEALVTMLEGLASKGVAVVVATHDSLVSDRGDDVLCLEAGRLVA